VTPIPDPAEIGRSLALLYTADEVVEVRVPKSRHGTISGYFTDRQAQIER
jgi:hypothetical protein